MRDQKIKTLILLLLGVGLACAEEGDYVPPGAQDADAEQQEALNRVVQELAAHPEMAESLAQRIARSRIADMITGETDPQRRLQDIRNWIGADPASAAGIAMGLAQDDASGTRRYENMVSRTTRSRLVANPNASKGIFGRLKESGKNSRIMSRDTDQIADEEQSELLKTMFEGKGSQSSKIITQEEHLKDPDKGGVAPGGLSGNYLDRLSDTNLRGYSPQVQSLQSEMNRRRPPGAPKLIETGRLNHETLSYPRHSMLWDLQRLERRLRYERAWALAKALGREKDFTEEQLLDPAVEAELVAQALGRGKSVSPRFMRRQGFLQKAAAAVKSFERAALPAKDPLQITRGLLASLGASQKEAARWITAAGLEEELQRLDLEEGFLTTELLDAIERCPVDAAARQAYKSRGAEFLKKVKALKTNDEQAVKELENDAWLSRIGAIEKLLEENVALRRNLTRDLQAYVRTAFHFAATAEDRPRWRQILDGYIRRLSPGSSYAKRSAARERERSFLRDIFVKIGQGNLDAAHSQLQSYEPSAATPSKR